MFHRPNSWLTKTKRYEKVNAVAFWGPICPNLLDRSNLKAMPKPATKRMPRPAAEAPRPEPQPEVPRAAPRPELPRRRVVDDREEAGTEETKSEFHIFVGMVSGKVKERCSKKPFKVEV